MKNGHNYSKSAQSQILLYMHQWPMVPDHGTQYEESLSSHYRGMCKDGYPDGLVDRRMDWTRSLILIMRGGKPELLQVKFVIT